MKVESFQLAFENPRYVSPVSAWVEHIPFAFAAVQMLQPGTVVELGTHLGDSYCAFCQAVDQLNLKTHCIAVDSWEGDDQAGHYGPQVLAELRKHHDPKYARFSRLLQATFDDASKTFLNESVDLLHIDGLHTYDAVKHDLETWWPKLSEHAVVLIHDTQVAQEDFGVKRLWEEVSQKHTSFEFTHGYGLGVLLVGPRVPRKFVDFVGWAQHHTNKARQIFASLGQRIVLARAMDFLAPLLEEQRVLLLEAKGVDTATVGAGLTAPQAVAGAPDKDLKGWLDQARINLDLQNHRIRAIVGLLAQTRHKLFLKSQPAEATRTETGG